VLLWTFLSLDSYSIEEVEGVIVDFLSLDSYSIEEVEGVIVDFSLS
jgi:hypothetical protein